MRLSAKIRLKAANCFCERSLTQMLDRVLNIPLTMMLGFSLQNFFHISSIALLVFTQIKLLPHDLPKNSLASHEGKINFLNHNFFRLYALCSRRLSSFPCMVFLNVFRVSFFQMPSCFTCQCSLSVSPILFAQRLYYCTKHEHSFKNLSNTFYNNH